MPRPGQQTRYEKGLVRASGRTGYPRSGDDDQPLVRCGVFTQRKREPDEDRELESRLEGENEKRRDRLGNGEWLDPRCLIRGHQDRHDDHYAGQQKSRHAKLAVPAYSPGGNEPCLHQEQKHPCCEHRGVDVHNHTGQRCSGTASQVVGRAKPNDNDSYLQKYHREKELSIVLAPWEPCRLVRG
jgi:hypothetical protein